MGVECGHAQGKDKAEGEGARLLVIWEYGMRNRGAVRDCCRMMRDNYALWHPGGRCWHCMRGAQAHMQLCRQTDTDMEACMRMSMMMSDE